MKIYKKGNYIIVEDGTEFFKENAIPLTVYTDTNSEFKVMTDERNDTIIVRIKHTDITAGQWEDESGVLYTIPSMLTFLRGNTAYLGGAGGVSSIVGGDNINITNGSGPIVTVDFEDTLHNLIAYVDLVNGDDLSAIVGNETKPFSTVFQAIQNSNAGGLVILRPGTYGAISLKDGVDIYAQGQVTLSKIQDNTLSVKSNIFGDGDFNFIGNAAIDIQGTNSNVNIKCNRIQSSGVAIQAIPVAAGGSLYLNIECNDLLITATNYVITPRGNSFVTLNIKNKVTHNTATANYMAHFVNFTGDFIMNTNSIGGNGRLFNIEPNCSGNITLNVDYVDNSGDIVFINRSTAKLYVNVSSELKYTGVLFYSTTQGSTVIFDGGKFIGADNSVVCNALGVGSKITFKNIHSKSTMTGPVTLFNVQQGDLFITNSLIVIDDGGITDSYFVGKSTDSLTSRIFIKDTDFIARNVGGNAQTCTAYGVVGNGEIYFKNVNSTLDNEPGIIDVATVSGFIGNDTGLDY